MSARPDVSVVISNYNTRDRLEACLRSLTSDLETSGLRFEVLVVDDASSDGSPEMVAASFPAVRLLQTGVNCGYAKANNIGVRAAGGAAVLLLNSDTVVMPGAIPALHQTLRQSRRLAAVGPVLLNPDHTVQRSCWRYPMTGLVGNMFALFTVRVWDDYRRWDGARNQCVDWMSSAAMMIDRAALDRVGLFDEAFWVYGVDIDWAVRAHRAGYRFLAVAGARIIHHGRSSWGTMGTRMRLDHMRSQDRLFRKHYGRAGWLFYRAAMLCSSAVRLVVWGIPCLLGNRRLDPKVAFLVESVRWAVRGDRGGTVRYGAPAGGRGFEVPL